MATIGKIRRDFEKADANSVERLIKSLGDRDVLSRRVLTERLEAINRAAATSDTVPEQGASAAIFFGGRPVVGQLGVESEFASTALSKFQDLVSKIHASEHFPLGLRGMVPGRSSSTLHVTDVARGSFGFVLRELNPQSSLIDTPLKKALEDATRLLTVFAFEEDQDFSEHTTELDARVLSTTKAFFNHLQKDAATMRLVVGEQDKNFNESSINRALERASTTIIEENESVLQGVLGGILPDAHQFEFDCIDVDGPRSIRGKVDRELDKIQLSNWNRDLASTRCSARIRKKSIIRNENLVSESYTLLHLDVANA